MSKTENENLKEYENLKAENIEFYRNEQNLNLDNLQDSKTKLKKNTIDSTSTTDSLKENFPNNKFEKISIEKRKLTLPNDSNDKKYELTIKKKNEFEIQNSFYEKVINQKIWGKSIKNEKNNLIIFDWDDTLLCTSVLSPYGYFDDDIILSNQGKEKIKKLEENVKTILELSIKKSTTYIITNSEPGWVEYSCKRFFPLVYPLLSQLNIISARGLFEKIFPNNSRMWKIETFNNIFHNFNYLLPTNIICIGDSFYEIEAGKNLGKKFNNCFVKTIKFKECPNIEELSMQIFLVIEKFNYIFSAEKNWTIKVEKKIPSKKIR